MKNLKIKVLKLFYLNKLIMDLSMSCYNYSIDYYIDNFLHKFEGI